MREWKHKAYEIYLFRNLTEKIKALPYISILITFAATLVYYKLLRLGIISPISNENADNDFGLIWQIHASILALIFVAFSFLIAVLNADDLNRKIARRLARKINFTGIAISNTLFNLWVGYTALASKVDPWAESTTIFALVFLITSIVYLFHNLFRYLFRADLLKSLLLLELKSNLKEFLEFEIIGKTSQQLFEKISKEQGINVGYDSEDSLCRAIIGKEKGVIRDVDIIALKRLARHIKSTIPVKDFTKGTTDNFKATLLKGFMFYVAITSRRDTIAIVAKTEGLKVDILAQSVYVTADSLPREAFREDLDQLIDGVPQYLETSPNKLIEIMDYIGILIDESLTVLREYQIEFNYENSKQITTFDWRSIYSLVYGLDDIFKEIYRSGNTDLIYKTVTFIDARISSAIESKNHFLFKEFIHNYARLYYLAISSENINLNARKDIIKNIHRKIQDLFKYGLKLGADDIGDIEEVDFHSGVALDIQKVVRELNKIAIDYQDIENIATFSKTLEIVSCTLDRYRDVSILKSNIEILQMDENLDTKQKEIKIKHLNRLIRLNQDLNKYDISSRFALGAWTLERYRTGKADRKFLIKSLVIFQKGFHTIQNLAEAFFEIKKNLRADETNILSWERQGREDGVYSIQMNWLTYFYVFTALKLVPTNINSDQFIYGDDIREYSSSYLEVILREIREILNLIESNKSIWESVLPTQMPTSLSETLIDDRDKKENLFKLHENGIKKRKEEEAELLANAPIDDKKWQDFQKEFLKEYERSRSLKKIIKEHGNYKDLTNETPVDDISFGIKTLDFKYSFIKDWYVSTFGVAENFSSAMAKGEDSKIALSFLEKIGKVSLVKTDKSVKNQIDEMISQLTDTGYMPNVILIGNWLKLYQLRQENDFISNTTTNRGNLQGKYKGVSVYHVHSDLHNKLVVLDLNKLGVFRQQQVKGEPGKEIYMGVRIITDLDIDEWIKNNADVIKRDGIQMPRDEIKKYMQERVLLEILQKFEFEVTDPKAGVYSEIDDRLNQSD